MTISCRSFALALAALVAAACGGGRAKVGSSAADARQCQPPDETTRVLVVDWDPALRAELEAGGSGVAVVRYDGCELELLADCLLDGEYVAEDAPRARSGFELRDRDALAAKLPVGAGDLSAGLGGGGALDVEYVTAGSEKARLKEQSRGMLRGRCDRATHFVRAMVRGAYAISVGGAEARVVRAGGDLARCRDAGTSAADPACRAIVEVALTPVAELTSDRDDLYTDLGKDVAAISEMEEALRALQGIAGAPEGGVVGGVVGAAPSAASSAIAQGILAIPDGGSDAWDAAVVPVLLGAFDENGSSSLDTVDEIAAIPCDVLATMDGAIKKGRGGMTALRTTYGFAKEYLWVGYALGFDEKIRADADARLANCGL